MIYQLFQIFIIFFKLGCTSFGGPIAHLSYFHDEFVIKRKWLDEHSYADLVALCQFLPGPASSQVGMALGLSRAGLSGALFAWIGFTLPSTILLVLFALGISNLSELSNSGWLHGLKIVAVAVVAQALWGMGSKLCLGKKRATMAVTATIIAAIIPSTLSQILIIILGGIFGFIFLRESESLPHKPLKIPISNQTGFLLLLLFFLILFLLPFGNLVLDKNNNHALQLFESFFRAGSLVFGGGHVILPLLQAAVVPTGWVSNDAFMAGYGAAQAIPGPLFTFSAYLGAVSNIQPNGILGATICLLGAFTPSFLLVAGTIPFWEKLRKYDNMRFAMSGVNSAVVGILLAAFYNPVWISAIHNQKDFSLALMCFLFLTFWKTPPWIVVLSSAIIANIFL